MFSVGMEEVFPEKILRGDVFQPASFGFMEKQPFERVDRSEVSSIINDNLKMLAAIKLPNHFDRETLASFLEKMIKEELEKDPLHKLSVKIIKYAKDFRTYMRQYFDNIFSFHEKLREDRIRDVFATSRMYIQSDLPPSFARTLTLSFLTECKYFDILDMRMHQERLALITFYNNRRKFDRLCEQHNRWVDPLAVSLDSMDETRVGLMWYVDFCNSKTVDEIFKPKAFKKSTLDTEYFFAVLLNLQHQIDQLRHSLTRISRETFGVTANREDPTTNMLCSVMEIMGS